MHGRFATTLVLGGALACAGGRPRSGDAAGDAAALDGAADRAGSDGSTAPDGEAPDGRPARTGIPLPAGIAPPRRLFDDRAQLLGDGLTGCSHQEPASGDGDRWCAFALPGADGKSTELWVMDVTAAARDAVPACDGSSPRCLRLTANLWTGSAIIGAIYPYSDQFDGDTLVYYADAVSGPGQSFKGPVYAWRPGWAQGHPITDASGFLCFGHRQGPAVACVDDVMGDPGAPDSVRLRVGRVAEATGPLPPLGRAHPVLSNGNFAFQIGFSRSGEVFAYSSGDPDPAVASLQVVAVSEVGTAAARVAVSDVAGWEIANDDRKVYFMRGNREDGALAVADFPAGTSELAIDTHVSDFLPLGEDAPDRGIIFLTKMGLDRRAFRLLRDRTLPKSALTVFTYRGLLEDVRVSPDVRFTAWLDEGFTGRVVPHDGSETCVLNPSATADVFEPVFLDDAALMFWNEAQDGTDRRDGFFAPPQRCKERRRFAESVAFYLPVGNRGLIFADEQEALEEGATLKYARIGGGGSEWPSEGAVRIAEHVATTSVVLVGRDPLLLVFATYRSATAAPGTFVFGPVPF